MHKSTVKILLAVVLFSTVAFAQGFGTFSKKVVTINRLLPATVNLNGKKIRVEATAESSVHQGADMASLLKIKLVTMIQKDPRFILDDVAPETILHFAITNYYVEEWTVNAGTNTASKAYRGKIEVAYQAIDAGTKAALDSENLTQTAGMELVKTQSWSDRFSASRDKRAAASISENETRDQLVSGIVESMGRRVAPTELPFEERLPGGKALEPLSSLAMNHRWGALDEQADKMDKLPKAEDDTYRLYLVALAKEAQAYDLTREVNDQQLGKRKDISPQEADAEFQRAQKYMGEASRIYKSIVAANPKEEKFRPGDARTEEAMTIYATIARYQEEYAKAIASKNAKKAETAAAPSPAEAGRNPLGQILEFCSRGIAPEVVKEYILSPDFLVDAKSSGYKFDFGSDPIRLNDSCKQNAAVYQKMMRDRLNSGASAKTRRN